ncbi:Protein N-acetyltransferase, RimJ/RimL family [Saccharopolyspora shandongensis]|uniref:Protein N-acetyltransferase, RimJ/RimL family n=1 Tax=Saccharopolyspora shandongensis TaxID=418495 RepID=A0A1H2XJ14_9PSEU|nr:GNAT family N-acetyltransferase [Saccharopolyspora shandongensis]SDW92678.1 Protein N-acetyltransferase, RimJ/RimL family [Saccharopolyspora shandongensis]
MSLALPENLTDTVIAIRHLADRDAEPFAAGTTDAAVRRFAHLPTPHYTAEIVREQIRGVIADGLREGNLAVLAIADAADDRFLGSITVFDIRGTTAEVGFWLNPAARGRGATRRALDLVAAWTRDHGITTLRARTEDTNTASQQALERAGFRHVAGPTPEISPSGETINGLTYHRDLA